MKTLARVLVILSLCAFSMAASAHVESLGRLQIVHPWAKPSLKGVPNGAAYMAISNSGEADDVLVSASSDIAEAVELHAMEMNNGIMRMRPIEGGVTIPAGGTVAFEPGGKHLMLIGLNRRLKAGETFNLTLQFEKAGQKRIEVRITKTGSAGDQDSGS